MHRQSTRGSEQGHHSVLLRRDDGDAPFSPLWDDYLVVLKKAGNLFLYAEILAASYLDVYRAAAVNGNQLAEKDTVTIHATE